ncbi:MAG: carbamate kinase [Ignavibacteriales bacterium]|nr:MAG: carbamate kinase [Ignavibacteriaceae bacterium]MBW7873597.1 carbamate kinase [Ignavibacteria bacterium]MCZ2143827.1 carbamate kinase [Ignavibacteriales bacterium]OQY69963.1 MAG: carbamate kinase [Ignavibacteriales bacterium UTCHB3]MBV6445902.1 Carbamate kinase 1 [Ignavibacteriaceae bacterium]
MSKLAVVALGGNALLKGNQEGTIVEQENNAMETCKTLVSLIERDYRIVITHGNGPQVGNLILMNEAGNEKFYLPKMPLDVCVAESEGQIAHIVAQQLERLLLEHEIDKEVISLLTHVEVDGNDPAFQNPTKPVGQFFSKEEADKMAEINGWQFREDPRKRGWRRVVPSPKPLFVRSANIIKQLTDEGHIVICVGGGGIPVIKNERGMIHGVEAVIDKDLASSVLATQIGADELIILTDIPKAYINFHKENEVALNDLSLEEAESYLLNGEFAAGSMGPKIEAAINFVRNGGKIAEINEAGELKEAHHGTRIIGNNG